MSEPFNGLAALDRNIANRWKIRTDDNVRHVLTAANIDFIFADIIKSVVGCASAFHDVEHDILGVVWGPYTL